MRGRPAIVITEYFLESAFIDTIETAIIGTASEDNRAGIDMGITDRSGKDEVQQQMAGR